MEGASESDSTGRVLEDSVDIALVADVTIMSVVDAIADVVAHIDRCVESFEDQNPRLN